MGVILLIMDKNLKQLFRTKHPYSATKRDEAYFLAAIGAACRDFMVRSPQYRKICRQYGFTPKDLRGMKDLQKLPPLPTAYLKRSDISVPHRHIIEVTSSGTGGRVSRMQYSLSELLSLAHMAIRLGREHHLFSIRPTHYIMLGYQPRRDNQTVISKTAFLSSFYAPPLAHTYALKYRDGAYHADLDGVRKRMEELRRQRRPVRIIGFPAYLYFLLEEMKKRNLKYRMPKGSKILLGGGWKQFGAQEIPKEELFALAEERLGIGKQDIHEFFSAAEHPVLYCSCPNHHFHIPAYGRVLIRDVRTLEPVEKGKTGIINLITPLHSNLPIVSILTDDLGCVRPGSACGCGIKSDYLEIYGRVGVQGVKTCAGGAQEKLRDGADGKG